MWKAIQTRRPACAVPPERSQEDPLEDDPEVIQALIKAKQVARTPQDVWDNFRKQDEPGVNTRDTASSIELLRESLPELDDRAFGRMYRLAFMRAHAGLLGYDESHRGENRDEILDCLAAERNRRWGLAREGQGS
jgi:hypothetical protein